MRDIAELYSYLRSPYKNLATYDSVVQVRVLPLISFMRTLIELIALFIRRLRSIFPLRVRGML